MGNMITRFLSQTTGALLAVDFVVVFGVCNPCLVSLML